MDDNLKLTQLAMSEFKVDSVTDFCLTTHGNSVILCGNGFDFHILEMLYSIETLILLPYNVKYVSVSQEKPLTNLIKPIDLVKIYARSSVLESQAISLDPIYVTECSLEPARPRLLQAELINVGEHKHICCVLNTFGACDIMEKDSITKEWKSVATNLNKILVTDAFPIKKSPSDLKTFTDFRSFIDIYLITAFSWSKIADYIVIYVGTALGYVVALKYLPGNHEFEVLFQAKTSLERISYITSKDQLMLVASQEGQVRVLKIDFTKMSLNELDFLWSKKDRMACRKAFITHSEEWNSYLIVFPKGAHVLAYRLNEEGHVISNSTLYTSGIKITGKQLFHFLKNR